jgi:hypothetical protein
MDRIFALPPSVMVMASLQKANLSLNLMEMMRQCLVEIFNVADLFIVLGLEFLLILFFSLHDIYIRAWTNKLYKHQSI